MANLTASYQNWLKAKREIGAFYEVLYTIDNTYL